MKRSEILAEIRDQWASMTTIPVMEFSLPDGEYLTVELSLNDNIYNPSIDFEFDTDGKSTWFSGEVEGKNGSHRIRITQFSQSLDCLVQDVYGEVLEGFIIPNNLYAEQE